MTEHRYQMITKFIHETVKIGENTTIEPTVVIQEGCEIGDNCFIGHNTVLRPYTIIGNNTKVGHCCVFEGKTRVGNDCVIQSQSHITLGAIIEDLVFLAPGVIGVNDRIMVHARRHIKPFKVEPFIVMKGARIGAGAIILPRVVIGKNAVVGAGSVVTKSVADNAIVFGSPAKFIRWIPEEEAL